MVHRCGITNRSSRPRASARFGARRLTSTVSWIRPKNTNPPPTPTTEQPAPRPRRNNTNPPPTPTTEQQVSWIRPNNTNPSPTTTTEKRGFSLPDMNMRRGRIERTEIGCERRNKMTEREREKEEEFPYRRLTAPYRNFWPSSSRSLNVRTNNSWYSSTWAWISWLVSTTVVSSWSRS
jgi:hypothetical protein